MAEPDYTMLDRTLSEREIVIVNLGETRWTIPSMTRIPNFVHFLTHGPLRNGEMRVSLPRAVFENSCSWIHYSVYESSRYCDAIIRQLLTNYGFPTTRSSKRLRIMVKGLQTVRSVIQEKERTVLDNLRRKVDNEAVDIRLQVYCKVWEDDWQYHQQRLRQIDFWTTDYDLEATESGLQDYIENAISESRKGGTEESDSKGDPFLMWGTVASTEKHHLIDAKSRIWDAIAAEVTKLETLLREDSSSKQ